MAEPALEMTTARELLFEIRAILLNLHRVVSDSGSAVLMCCWQRDTIEAEVARINAYLSHKSGGGESS